MYGLSTSVEKTSFKFLYYAAQPCVKKIVNIVLACYTCYTFCICCIAKLKNGSEIVVHTPSQFPKKVDTLECLEPMVMATLTFPDQYLGKMIQLCMVNTKQYDVYHPIGMHAHIRIHYTICVCVYTHMHTNIYIIAATVFALVYRCMGVVLETSVFIKLYGGGSTGNLYLQLNYD